MSESTPVVRGENEQEGVDCVSFSRWFFRFSVSGCLAAWLSGCLAVSVRCASRRGVWLACGTAGSSQQGRPVPTRKTWRKRGLKNPGSIPGPRGGFGRRTRRATRSAASGCLGEAAQAAQAHGRSKLTTGSLVPTTHCALCRQNSTAQAECVWVALLMFSRTNTSTTGIR